MFKHSASIAVGRRSPLSELLVLLLVAGLSYPGLGVGSLPQANSSGGVRARNAVAGAEIRGAPRQIKPLSVHDPSTPRAVLDDDPAILGDNSEECIQGPIGFAPPATSELVSAIPPATIRVTGRLVAGFEPGRPGLLKWFCSYRC